MADLFSPLPTVFPPYLSRKKNVLHACRVLFPWQWPVNKVIIIVQRLVEMRTVHLVNHSIIGTIGKRTRMCLESGYRTLYENLASLKVGFRTSWPTHKWRHMTSMQDSNRILYHMIRCQANIFSKTKKIVRERGKQSVCIWTANSCLTMFKNCKGRGKQKLPF